MFYVCVRTPEDPDDDIPVFPDKHHQHGSASSAVASLVLTTVGNNGSTSSAVASLVLTTIGNNGSTVVQCTQINRVIIPHCIDNICLLFKLFIMR